MTNTHDDGLDGIVYEGLADGIRGGERLDRFLGEKLRERGVSRVKVQEWIKAGLALVDGRVETSAKLKLAGGERVVLRGRACETAVAPERGELTILWRDEHLAVIDKPAGLTAHPAPSCPEGTLVHRLLHHFPEISGQHESRPGIVHRLDKDTSGLMMVALSEPARARLTEAFADREVRKSYLAIVHGVPEPRDGHVELAIGRHPTHKTKMAVLSKGGRPASSDYKVLWAAPDASASLVAVRIHTGRTHQIRVHMTALGHPLVGDRIYGPGPFAGWEREHPWAARLARRQMLHAHRLAFAHPVTGEQLSFRLPPPKDFSRLPLALARVVQRVVIVGMPGSGKSAFAARLARRGVPVFNADAAVAALYAPGADGSHLIGRRFGERFLSADGGVDKRALFFAMREDQGMRREVESLVHPLVEHQLREFYASHRHERIVVAEVPLFFEGGWDQRNLADAVVGVRAPASMRRKWLCEKRGVDEASAAVLEGWQWPEEAKLARADVVVDNPGDPEGLDKAATEAMARLRAMRVTPVKALWARLCALWGAGSPR